MKKLFILFMLAGAAGAYAQFWKPKAKPTPTPPAAAQTAEAVRAGGNSSEVKKIIRELNSSLLAAKEDNKNLRASLEGAEKNLEISETRTREAQKQADLLREWGIAKQNEAFEWLAKHEKVLKRYHDLKFVASVVGGIFGFVFGVWLMRFVPAVYAAYALSLPLVFTGISAGWVWIFF
jgi:hypothetical protein